MGMEIDHFWTIPSFARGLVKTKRDNLNRRLKLRESLGDVKGSGVFCQRIDVTQKKKSILNMLPNIFSSLNPQEASWSEMRGRELFFGKADCHTATS